MERALVCKAKLRSPACPPREKGAMLKIQAAANLKTKPAEAKKRTQKLTSPRAPRRRPQATPRASPRGQRDPQNQSRRVSENSPWCTAARPTQVPKKASKRSENEPVFCSIFRPRKLVQIPARNHFYKLKPGIWTNFLGRNLAQKVGSFSDVLSSFFLPAGAPRSQKSIFWGRKMEEKIGSFSGVLGSFLGPAVGGR